MIEFLNICYKYINDMIDANKLIELLNNLDKSKLDINKFNDLIDNVKKVDSGNNTIVNYKNIFSLIVTNAYFNECMDNLSDYELLEFIAQFICASNPPRIDNETFDKLVNVGIKKREDEYLWRLAFNYSFSDFNFDKIIDYYINNKDGYYLVESISAFGDKLNIDSIINKINDKKLINYLLDNKTIINDYITDDMLDKLRNKLD